MTNRDADAPLVSIVIACYNTPPAMLVEAVESAKAQTYAPVEVIVVDDGSTEAGTREAVVRLDGVRVIRRDNGGVASARNHAMTEASGEFLLPLDGDDVLEPDYLAATVPVLRDDTGLAIVSTQATYFGERSGPVDLPDPSLPRMVAENSIHNTSLFRRSDFDRLGGYDESLRLGFEDHEWWVRLLLDGGRARVLDDFLFHYRIRPTSRNSVAASSDVALRELRAAMVRNNPEHTEALASMALATLDGALWRMHEAEARVAHLEHHLGPVVKAFDRSPRLRAGVDRLRRWKNRRA